MEFEIEGLVGLWGMPVFSTTVQSGIIDRICKGSFERWYQTPTWKKRSSKSGVTETAQPTSEQERTPTNFAQGQKNSTSGRFTIAFCFSDAKDKLEDMDRTYHS